MMRLHLAQHEGKVVNDIIQNIFKEKLWKVMKEIVEEILDYLSLRHQKKKQQPNV